MQAVDVFIDPICPWAWVTSQWLREVAPRRDLRLCWRSYCLEIRDEGLLPPTMPQELRRVAPELRSASHRVLRVFEALRAGQGEDAVDSLFSEWGRRVFVGFQPTAPVDGVLAECLHACGLDPGLSEEGDDPTWDVAIGRSMEDAYQIGGPKTQTPVVALAGDPPRGFKGPVMASAPSGEAALRLWDAFVTLAEEADLFELARPRQIPLGAPPSEASTR